jgi:hypothetical protein
MRTILLLALSLILCAADPPAVDHDALAAQRHAEAAAKQAASDQAASEKAPPVTVTPARWVLPAGKPVKVAPGWVRGEWVTSQGTWVVGAKTAALDGQAPISYFSVIDGGDWACLELDASGGSGRPRFVVRRVGGDLSMGPVAVEDRMPAAVTEWRPMKAK